MPVLPLGFLRAAGNMQPISYVLISVALRYVCALHLALSFLSGSLYLHTHAEQVQTPHCRAGMREKNYNAFCRNTALLIRNPHAGVVNEGTGYMPHLNTWPFPIADGVLSAWLWKLELGDKCYKQMYTKR